MNFDDIIADLSSPTFAARLGLASTPMTFLASLSTDATCTALVEALRDQGTAEVVHRELQSRLDIDFDRRYAHPDDLLIGALVATLIRAGRWPSEATVVRIASDPNLWWSPAIIDHFLREVGPVFVAPLATNVEMEHPLWEPGGTIYRPGGSPDVETTGVFPQTNQTVARVTQVPGTLATVVRIPAPPSGTGVRILEA